VAELFVVNGICGGTVFFLPDVPTVLGRSAECQIQIADPWVSSMHALFERRGEALWLVDLDSRNGTWVNDTRVRESRLAPGARLRFGKTAVELRDEPRPAAPILHDEGTVVRYLADLQAEARAGDAAEPRRDTDAGDRRTTRRGPGVRRQLAVLHEIGRALVDAPDLDACLSKILHAVAAAVRAERSSLLLMDAHGRMVVRASDPPGSAPRVSETVVATAARSRAGLLTVDAQEDLRFAGSQSVIAQGIRSCLCVPVWADNRILGMLVLDRGYVDPFTADDLELTTVVGYQAALAIERARFLERSVGVEAQRRRLLRHFPPDVAGALLSQEQLDRDPLEPQLREEVTVLRAGIDGLGSLAARVPPAELAALLREHVRSVAEAVFEERGTLDRLLPDGAVAAFGVPVPLPDAPARALRCAFRLLQRAEEAGRRLPPDRRYALRIGVETGRVLAGGLGPADRGEFGVLGEAVEAAGALEGAAAPGTVAVGPQAAARVQGAFELEPLPPRPAGGPPAGFRATGPARGG